MWFGTDNGLVRFDGIRFKVYGIEDGLPDPEVLELFEDSGERLWISCFQKKPCFLKNGIFFSSENDSTLNQLKVKSGEYNFYEDKNHKVWITGKGFDICYYKSSEALCFSNEDQKINSTLSITEIDDKLFAYGYSSIYDYTDHLSPKIIYSNYINPPLVRPSSYSIGNVFYFLRGHQLVTTNLIGQEIAETLQYLNAPNRLNSISYCSNLSIWICYPHSLEGAYKIEIGNPDKIKPIFNFLRGKRVSNVLEDKEKNTWFTTQNDGIFVMPEKAALIYDKYNTPEFISDNITAIALLPNDKLLIGNETGNIYILEKGSLNQILFKENFDPSRVRQIIPISNTDWVAAMDNSLYAETNKKQNHKYKADDPRTAPNHISAPKYIFHNSEKIWIAHARGLHYWGFDKELPTVVIARKRFTAIGKDSENNIWAGGIDGLLSEKDSFQINWGKKFKAISGRIIDIKQGKENQLWVATAEYGLLLLKVKNGEAYSVDIINDSLENKINGIKSLTKDQGGTIWLATNNGIYNLDNALHVRHFDKSDGLPSNDVNAVIIDQDTLWAATVAGLAKIQLNQGKGDGNFPTYISGIGYVLNGEAVNIDLVNHTEKNVIVVPSGASMIDVLLSGIHFGSAGTIAYEYIEQEKPLPIQWLTWTNLATSLSQRLKGKCDTFMVEGGRRYLGVHAPAGSFLTTVTAISKDGTRSSQPDSVMITILPFWYETAWFSILLLSIAGYIVWRFIRQWNKARKLQRVASELQLQAIKAQVNPHFVGNSINAIQQFFYPPDPITASQYISTFTSLLRQTMHLSEVPFISFRTELAFISDYLEMVKLRFGDRFEYTLSGNEEIEDETPFPAMLLQPILENATIHGLAPEGVARLNVKFQYDGQLLSCTISDNGVGIEASKTFKKTHNYKRVSKGINLLRKKIEVLNKMHASNIKIVFIDLTTIGGNGHGTKVTLSYSPNKISQYSVTKT